ncbi:MAG TPA: hypothetical protein PK649_01845 [Vicingus sp.]|nr:hypothetical protein [Vicingus sp.]
MYKVTAFKAIDNPTLCDEYIEGHITVLKEYGVPMVTSGKPIWNTNPNVYCVIAQRSDNGKMIGGIRLQIADGITPLPVEEAISPLDKGIHEMVKEYFDEGVGELCGLWNSKEVAGVGISFILVRAAISIVNQLQFKTLMGICAEYSLQMFTNVGFVIDKSLGENGEFPYPTDEYITRVLGIMNAYTLETAYSYDKERMLGLRKNVVQQREETGKKGVFSVDYNLNIKR